MSVSTEKNDCDMTMTSEHHLKEREMKESAKNTMTSVVKNSEKSTDNNIAAAFVNNMKGFRANKKMSNNYDKKTLHKELKNNMKKTKSAKSIMKAQKAESTNVDKSVIIAWHKQIHKKVNSDLFVSELKLITQFAAEIAVQLRMNIRKSRKVTKSASTNVSTTASNLNLMSTTAFTQIKKRKRALNLKCQKKKLKLSKDVSDEKWLENKQLLKVMKHTNIYSQHKAVSYVFSWCDLLYKKYHHILNITDSSNNSVLFSKDKWWFMNFILIKELHQKHLNVFNSHDQMHKKTSKMNKDVHNNTTDIYVSLVTKSEEHHIEDISRHILIKAVLKDHIEQNTEKKDDKECISKQWLKLKKKTLQIAEREVVINHLEKTIIKMKAEDIAMK